ncbi:MAG: hypothetical protein E6K97_04460 [Thaumarchaeota archaeon]|nr:MAG: hypothetical protein E6K97_04460 [Nitrososphaerota archaeon]
MRNIIYVSPLIISFGLLTYFTAFQDSLLLSGIQNPFSDSNAKVESISSKTSGGKYLVNLQYPELTRKGEPSFFMVNLLHNSADKQSRMRHVDGDFIILRDGIELYKMSTKYGEPLFHSINGVMLPSFPFSKQGMYKISVEIAGDFFIPINPVFANFSAMVSPTTDGNLKFNIST